MSELTVEIHENVVMLGTEDASILEITFPTSGDPRCEMVAGMLNALAQELSTMEDVKIISTQQTIE